MSDLRTELDEALGAVIPGPPPVEAAMRRGRRIRLRRRVAAVAGTLAIAVAVVAGYPALSDTAAPKAPAPTAPGPSGITVTYGLSPADGVIATGTVGGKRWQLQASTSSTGQECFTGVVGTARLGLTCVREASGQGATPDGWQENVTGAYGYWVTGVAPDVTDIVLTMKDHQQLRLVPVTIHGARLVGLIAPGDLSLASATAYLADGQAMAITELNPPGSIRPGTDVPPAATASLGPVSIWQVNAQEDPYGTCITADSNGGAAHVASCTPLAPLATLTVLGMVTASGNWPLVVYGSAPPYATSLMVRLAGGKDLQVPVVVVGTDNLWAFALSTGQSVQGWTAYSASGKPLGTESCPCLGSVEFPPS